MPKIAVHNGLQMQILTTLRNRPVALLWGGLSLSAIGDQLYTVALSWISVAVFGAAAGYLNALGCLSLLLTAVFVGGWVDGLEQRQAMLSADLVRAAILFGVVLQWMLTGTVSAISLVIAVVVLGAGQAVFRPAMQAVMPSLTPRESLPAVNALFDTTDRIARMLGPGLVGLLAGWVPTRHFLTLDGLTFLGSAATIVILGRVTSLPAIRRRRRGGMGVLAGILRGFRAVSRHGLLRFALGCTPLIDGGWFASLFLGVPLAIEHYRVIGPGGTGLSAYGLVISCYGTTNLISTLIVGNRPMPAQPARQMCTGMLMLGGGLLLLGVVPLIGLPHALLLPGFCLAAALGAPGGPLKDVPVAVLRQTEIPRSAVSAAMRAFLVVSNAGMLTAMAIGPTLFALNLPAGLVLSGGAIMAAGGIGFARFRPVRDPVR